MAKEYKSNIFDLLTAIDRGTYGLYETLTEVQRKEYSPFVTMRWLTGTTDERQILLINSLVNPHAFSLGKHPSLLTKLLVVANGKTQKRYKFIKAPAKAKSASRKLAVVMEYYGYSTREAMQVVHLVDAADALQMANGLGWQKDEVTALKKEL